MAQLITGRFAKEIDRYAIDVLGISSLGLMERAAEAVSERVVCRAEVCGEKKAARILICCGTGNNGADGLAAAAILFEKGYRNLCVLCCGDLARATSEFSHQQARLRACPIEETWTTEENAAALAETYAPAIIVDALFGIGLSRTVEGCALCLIQAMNAQKTAHGAWILSVDMPSGLDADGGRNLCATGEPVLADETLTFGFAKTGQYLSDAFGRCGRILAADIGYPAGILEEVYCARKDVLQQCSDQDKKGDLSGIPPVIATSDDALSRCLPALLHRDHRANKGRYKKLLLLAGSEGMAGAAFLSGLSAFRSGIGMVKIAGPEENRTILQSLLPEAMYESLCVERYGEQYREQHEERLREQLGRNLAWADAVVAGPGLSTSASAYTFFSALCSVREALCGKLLILDADALNLIAKNEAFRAIYHCGATVVITPHVGEMARLCGMEIAEVKKQPVQTALSYAKKHGISVVLKDCVTVIAAAAPPESRTSRTPEKAESAAPISPQDSLTGELALSLNLIGSAAMAKAGSGDVLTGAIAGMYAVIDAWSSYAKGSALGSGAPQPAPADFVSLAVWLHARAGELSGERCGVHSVLARELAESVGIALKNVKSALNEEKRLFN